MQIESALYGNYLQYLKPSQNFGTISWAITLLHVQIRKVYFHSQLKPFQPQNNTSGYITFWAITFPSEYKPGKDNVVTDALSRSFWLVVSTPHSSLVQLIHQDIETDPALSKLKDECFLKGFKRTKIINLSTTYYFGNPD